MSFQYARYNRNETEIKIPENCTGVIVGKAGATIKSFLEIRGIRSAIIRNGVLVVTGDPDSIKVLKEIVKN